MNDCQMGYSPTRVKAHKLLQVCKQVVASLFTSCQQVVFALLVSTHVKTHKLLQTCKQVVTSLFTNCSQDVFALLVPNLLEQVWSKLLTNCNKLDGTIRPVTRLFQQD